MPSLGRLGKLCAIDVFTSWLYEPAGPALVHLLQDEDSTVREWAATLAGMLGYAPAASELSTLAARLRADAVPPNWSEPTAVRYALTALKARRPAMPDVVATTREQHTNLDVWPAAQAEELLRALAQADQVILGFSVWRRREKFGLTWQMHESLDWELDRAASWAENVSSALLAAECEASALPTDRRDIVVALDWIDKSDET